MCAAAAAFCPLLQAMFGAHALLEKTRRKLKFQQIFTHGVEWKPYIVKIKVIYEFHSTPRVNIRCSLNFRRFFSISVADLHLMKVCYLIMLRLAKVGVQFTEHENDRNVYKTIWWRNLYDGSLIFAIKFSERIRSCFSIYLKSIACYYKYQNRIKIVRIRF